LPGAIFARVIDRVAAPSALAPSGARARRPMARLVAASCRVTCVVLAVGAFERSIAGAAVLASLLFLAIEHAFRATHPDLGTFAVALTGSLTAIAGSLPLVLLVPSLQLSESAVIATGLVTCASLPPLQRIVLEWLAGTDTRGCRDQVELGDRRLGQISLSQIDAQRVTSRCASRRRALSKKAFDITVASAGIVLTAPIWPLIAVVHVATHGGVILRQTRVGKNGALFDMYKLRSMCRDAEAYAGPVWALEVDPRVTAFGRFLRRTHIDELPQLWNVLKGEMSIVGPRPERPEIVTLLEREIPNWSHRHVVKPGITGWAQVCQGYVADAEGSEEKLSYDLWYLRNDRVILDAAICVRTLIAVGRSRHERYAGSSEAAVVGATSIESSKLEEFCKSEAQR
jgi:lipopolysaccharide/colanic/teichoic acid biosynthesis glycosyltransferase